MSEGELHVPRLGRLVAADGFRLVAAMNPFDAVGTARIASAIYDRTCRVLMDYQDAADEAAIVRRQSPDGEQVERAVELVRRTRAHPEVRVGSSVRGAIDLVLVAESLGALRGLPASDPGVSLDAALTALSGRLRLHEGAARTSEDVVRELWAQVYGAPPEREAEAEHTPGPEDPAAGDPSGKAPRPVRDVPPGRPATARS